MFNRTNCDRKPQLSGILTGPLNPRDLRVGGKATSCIISLTTLHSRSLPLIGNETGKPIGLNYYGFVIAVKL